MIKKQKMMNEVHKMIFATLIAEIILATFKDIAKEMLDEREWKYLDNATVACIWDQIQGGKNESRK